VTLQRDVPNPPLQDENQARFKRFVQAMHNGALNVVFCDGHVESPKIAAHLFDRTDSSLRRWNKDNEPHHERLR
jgi:prepilin-type processing-associated H-X9-DG protein